MLFEMVLNYAFAAFFWGQRYAFDVVRLLPRRVETRSVLVRLHSSCLACPIVVARCNGSAASGTVPSRRSHVVGDPLSRFINSCLPTSYVSMGVDEEKIGFDKIFFAACCVVVVHGLDSEPPMGSIGSNDYGPSLAGRNSHSADASASNRGGVGCDKSKRIKEGAHAASTGSSYFVIAPHVPKLNDCFLTQHGLVGCSVIAMPLSVDVELTLLLYDGSEDLIRGQRERGLDLAFARFGHLRLREGTVVPVAPDELVSAEWR